MIERVRPSAWLIVLGVAAVLLALLWASAHALRLERSEAASRAEAQFQESIRLALWRMDSALAPLLTREAARPYFHYSAFYPADRAYTSMWKAVEPGEVLVPSPLLQAHEPFVRLYFQIDDAGQVTSPQAPSGALRKRLDEANIPALQVIDAEVALLDIDRLFKPSASRDDAPKSPPAPAVESGRAALAKKESSQQEQDLSITAQDSPVTQREFEKRQQALQNVAPSQRVAAGESQEKASKTPTGDSTEDFNKQTELKPASPAARPQADAAILGHSVDKGSAGYKLTQSAPIIEISNVTPVWKRNPRDGRYELFLTRAVKLTTGTVTQGCWLDWPALKASLVDTVADLFPQADLAPVQPPAPVSISGRMLAGISAAILPGPPPAPPSIGWTPMRTTLAITWGAVLLTVNALAFALFASRELAERRGRFVSAVTHELRTPLTTFTLYSQMLADGIVRDEQAKSEYLGTLKREAQRLSRIVENVLEYARLGKPIAASHPRQIALTELLTAALPVLEQRAAQAGATLNCSPQADSIPTTILVAADPVTVERILFNLVDNACKYAGTAPIDLLITTRPTSIELSVVDHGPGVPANDRSLLFRAFERGTSLEHATIPGLGLGLALSRELARQLGGDLRLAETSPSGSRFALHLRRADR